MDAAVRPPSAPADSFARRTAGALDHGSYRRWVFAPLRCVVCGGPAFDCSCVRSALAQSAPVKL